MTDVRSTRRLGTGAIIVIVLGSCALLGALLGLFGQRLGIGGRSAIMSVWLAFLVFFLVIPRTRTTGTPSRQ